MNRPGIKSVADAYRLHLTDYFDPDIATKDALRAIRILPGLNELVRVAQLIAEHEDAVEENDTLDFPDENMEDHDAREQFDEAMTTLNAPSSIWDRGSRGGLFRDSESIAWRRKVWKHMKDKMNMSIYEIARQCGIRHSTIIHSLE